MAFLTDTEKLDIEKAIAQAERSTRGELIAVIAHSADDYLYVSLLWAALIALMVPGVIALAPTSIMTDWQYAIQISTFFILALAFRWPPALKLLTPRAIKHQRAHRLAVEQFLSHNLQQTRERNGVLLFVSVAEHYVEIIADDGLDIHVDQTQWDSIIADFTQSVIAGKVADGFIHAISSCGALLAKHFPTNSDDKNELPDHLIEI